MATEVTVCVLLFGDYPVLARRCLGPLAALWKRGLLHLRVGANSISSATKAVLSELEVMPTHSEETNICKYPMMRRLLREPLINTPLTMWFDDDSYVSADPVGWLEQVTLGIREADMLGSIYQIRLGGKQHEWIRRQPWYTGLAVSRGGLVRFATGGWWAVRTELLYRYGWPPEELIHRGGDVMLGELCRQQNLRLKHFNRGVSINADDSGRESAAPRRGFDSKPVGW
ncbi:MAG: hypothetical protein L0312_16260 [Acidobacteria bacterium]|nr:hypothetical protein [Acidobacteriota bacterium]